MEQIKSNQKNQKGKMLIRNFSIFISHGALYVYTLAVKTLGVHFALSRQ